MALDVGLRCCAHGMVAAESTGPTLELPHHVAQDCVLQPCHGRIGEDLLGNVAG